METVNFLLEMLFVWEEHIPPVVPGTLELPIECGITWWTLTERVLALVNLFHSFLARFLKNHLAIISAKLSTLKNTRAGTIRLVVTLCQRSFIVQRKPIQLSVPSLILAVAVMGPDFYGTDSSLVIGVCVSQVASLFPSPVIPPAKRNPAPTNGVPSTFGVVIDMHLVQTCSH